MEAMFHSPPQDDAGGIDDDFDSFVMTTDPTLDASVPRWMRTVLRSKLDGTFFWCAASLGLLMPMLDAIPAAERGAGWRVTWLKINGATTRNLYVDFRWVAAAVPMLGPSLDHVREKISSGSLKLGEN